MVKPLSDAFVLLLVEKSMWAKDVHRISTLVHRNGLGCCVLTKRQCHEGEKWENLIYLLLWLYLHYLGSDSPQHGYFPPRGMLVSYCSFKSEQEHTRRQSWVAEKCPGRQLGKNRFILSSRTKLVVEPAPSSIKQTSVLRKSGAGIVQELLCGNRPALKMDSCSWK